MINIAKNLIICRIFLATPGPVFFQEVPKNAINFRDLGVRENLGHSSCK